MRVPSYGPAVAAALTAATARLLQQLFTPFLYVSNRGHNSIAIYRVDTSSTGRLHPIGWEPVQGVTPKNLAIDPSGGWLFVNNAKTDSNVIFSLDARTGGLSTISKIEMKKPMRAVFNTLG